MGLHWNVWIIVLAPSYEKIITSSMVNLGWEVKALSEKGVNAHPEIETSGVMLGYRIYEPKGYDSVKVNDMIEKILSKNKMYYFGFIVAETYDSSWRSSNIEYPKNKETPKDKPTLN